MRRGICIISLFFGIVIGFCSVGSATNYYVATNGSDSNDGLGPEASRAWRTLMHAVNIAHGGDAIFIRGGTYSGQEIWMQKNSGHGGSAQTGYLTITNYQSEIPIFSGSGGRWILYGVGYIKIEGINFVNPCTLGLLSQQGIPENIEIRRCHFSGAYSVYAGALNVLGRNILVENNVLSLTPSGSTNDHGIYILAGSGNGVSYTTDGVIVRGNRVSGVSGYLIHLYDERKDYSDPSRLITNVIIERNYCENSTARAGILAATGPNTEIRNLTIKNNIVNNVSTYGIATLYGDRGLGISNVNIYNNTIFDYDGAGIYIGTGTNTVEVKNNIVHKGAGTGSYHIQNFGSSCIAEANCYYPVPASLSGLSDLKKVEDDPRFIAPSSDDFSIAFNSAAIDNGVSISSVTTDYVGTVRPVGYFYDIGAYEYAEGAPVPSGSEIHLSATSHDFGAVNVGNTADWVLMISNIGSSSLTISDIVSTHYSFNVVSPSFPRNVTAGTSINVVARFSPEEIGSVSGTLSVISNDVDEGTVEVTLSGSGVMDSVGDVLPPVANAGIDKVGVVGQSIDFDGSLSTDDVGITSYQWDFDSANGIQIDSTGVQVNHTYIDAGTYQVTLTVNDVAGNGPVSDTLMVTIEEIPTGDSTKVFGDSTGSDFTGTCFDTYLNLGQYSGMNFSTDPMILSTYTWPTNSVANRIVMKWGLSGIPTNATVQSALLQLYMYEGDGDSQYEVSVHPVINNNPVITMCNWNTYDGSHAWTGGENGGAQDMGVVEDSVSISLASEYYSWNVTNMVQEWVSNPPGNYGLILNSDSIAASGSHRFFRPTEYENASQRPKLIVTYSLGGGDTEPLPPTGLKIVQNR